MHFPLCVDYRQFNGRRARDAYALPRVDEVLNGLAGNKFFSVLDMKSGYYPLEIEESHKERTGLTADPLGFFEYNRLPFGLSSAPATYQRFMSFFLGFLYHTICEVFLDDIIIFAETFDEHLERHRQLFKRFRQCNLKISSKEK